MATIMRHLIAATGVLMLSGCAHDAAPNLFNGRYYMAGDPTCVRIRQLSENRIMCTDNNGYDKGYRDAMTYEQIQMYQMNIQYQQAQMQQFGQQLQQTGQSFQNTGQQILQQSQQYSAPQVTPITPPGGYRTKCLVNGNYVNCRSNY